MQSASFVGGRVDDVRLDQVAVCSLVEPWVEVAVDLPGKVAIVSIAMVSIAMVSGAIVSMAEVSIAVV